MASLNKPLYYDCPECFAGLSVIMEGEDMHCMMCSRDWTIYTWPAGMAEYIREQRSLRETDNS